MLNSCLAFVQIMREEAGCKDDQMISCDAGSLTVKELVKATAKHGSGLDFKSIKADTDLFPVFDISRIGKWVIVHKSIASVNHLQSNKQIANHYNSIGVVCSLLTLYFLTKGSTCWWGWHQRNSWNWVQNCYQVIFIIREQREMQHLMIQLLLPLSSISSLTCKCIYMCHKIHCWQATYLYLFALPTSLICTQNLIYIYSSSLLSYLLESL